MNEQKLAELHNLIDEWAAKEFPVTIEFAAPTEPARELPKDKRVIRTKSTGDRVYLIDEVAKTKAWVTTEDILTKLGFTQADVQEVDDSALVGYAMIASIYKI